MSKAYRCDNPMCKEFFDPYELQDQYATIEVTLHNREIDKPIYYTYCLCPKCTYTLKELIGMN